MANSLNVNPAAEFDDFVLTSWSETQGEKVFCHTKLKY